MIATALVDAASLKTTVEDIFGTPITTIMRTAFSGGLKIAGTWVMTGASAALLEVAHTIGLASTPNLTSTAFADTYLRVSALAVMLTLPFLFAAMAQAMLRGDFPLLVRAVAVHLPAALIGMSLAVPLVSLLLSVTDWMCSFVGGPSTSGGAQFLVRVSSDCISVGALTGSTFLLCLLAMLTVLAALALTVELLIREAAVYVVVLMTPLAFAAMVWPARRVWALRTMELLLALILSKFVIVAVLALAGAMVGTGGGSGVQLISALALLTLACFAPWALVRLIPLSEGAAHAADSVHQAQGTVLGQSKQATQLAVSGSEAIPAMLARLGSVPTEFADDGSSESSSSAATGSLGQPIAALEAPAELTAAGPAGAADLSGGVTDGAIGGVGSEVVDGIGSGVSSGASRGNPSALAPDSAGAAPTDAGPETGTVEPRAPGALTESAGQSSTPTPRFQSDSDYPWSEGTILGSDDEADRGHRVDAVGGLLAKSTYDRDLDGIGPDTTLLSTGSNDDE